MEAYEAILTRRSIRTYTSDPVPPELIHDLLEAAMSAPSAHNRQPWHFLTITKREILDTLADILPYGKMLRHAPLCIIVCADKSIQEIEGYRALDCAAATENLLLAAHAKGLGGVWLAIYPRAERVESVSKLFFLPENITPVSGIAIGYPAEAGGGKADRFQQDRVHAEAWQVE